MDYMLFLAAFGLTLLSWGLLGVAGLQSRLKRVEHKLNVLMKHFNLDLNPGLSARVKQLAEDPAQKIMAIKVYREETGAGLAEAKAAVEAYIDGR